MGRESFIDILGSQNGIGRNQMIDNFVQKQYEPYHQVYIHPSGYRLLLGDITAASDPLILRAEKIDAVVTASSDMDHLSFEPHIRHHVYNLLDVSSENMAKHFSGFYELAESELQKTNLLVHCFAGISRSATLVLSYLMKRNGWSFKTAIAEVRKHRPQVLPNLGFERQLKAYQKDLQLLPTNERKFISKTSESKKHQQMKNASVGLPQIVSLGRTLGRSKILDHHPSSQMENRKITRMKELPLFGGEEQPVGIKKRIDKIESRFAYNPEPKKSALPKSFRKRSLSINKNRNEGLVLHELEYEQRRDQLTQIPQKFILKELQFRTQKYL